MGLSYHERDDCRLCGWGILLPVLELPPTPPANELTAETAPPSDLFPLRLAQCQACCHVQLPVVVDPSRLFTNYHYVSGTSPVFRKHLAQQALSIQPKSQGLVLEIGSNDGTLLNEFKQLGHRVLGIDPAQNLAAEANRQGLTTLPEFFGAALAMRILRDHGPADLVVANNVFAHADDLEGIARGVELLLSSHGRFVFEVGYLPAVLRGGYFDTVYHEHLSYHHLAPLRGFFHRLGMRLYDADYVDSQGGSIRCFVMREDDAPPPTERLVMMLDSEEQFLPAAIKALPGKVQAAADRYRELIGGLCTWDWQPKIVAFGAPAKAVTLMAAFDINPGRFYAPEVIYEENPLKQGLWTPAPRIPIRPAHELLTSEADVCVVFAWNFAEDIRARYRSFKGRWLVPLPEPRWL